MKILLIVSTFIMLLGFQNCEVVSEDPEAVVTQSKVTLGDNVSHLSFFEFPNSPQTGNWNGMIDEYRMDLESGDISYFGAGEKNAICIDDDLKTEIIDFARNTEICIQRTVLRENEDPVCTLEYRYGDVVFNLDTEVDEFIHLNINGSNGCLVSVSFCNEDDLETLKELKEAVASTPSNSCD